MNNTNDKPQYYTAIFLGFLYDWSKVFAVLSFCLAAGSSFDGLFNGMPRAFFLFLAGGIFVGLVVWLVNELPAQRARHELQLAQWQAEIDLLRSRIPQPVAMQTRVPFPPVAFVTFIWDWREKSGKFPTVDDCKTVGNFNRGLIQQWFEQLERAGALIGRVPYKYAGDPAPEWSRERFIEAAKRDNMLESPPTPK